LTLPVILSEEGFDAHKHILTTLKPESMDKIHGLNPDSPRFLETVKLKHWKRSKNVRIIYVSRLSLFSKIYNCLKLLINHIANLLLND
jgi:hypothetical protein